MFFFSFALIGIRGIQRRREPWGFGRSVSGKRRRLSRRTWERLPASGSNRLKRRKNQKTCVRASTETSLPLAISVPVIFLYSDDDEPLDPFGIHAYVAVPLLQQKGRNHTTPGGRSHSRTRYLGCSVIRHYFITKRLGLWYRNRDVRDSTGHAKIHNQNAVDRP